MTSVSWSRQAGGQGLSDDLCASHDIDLFVAGCILCELDCLGETADEDEVLIPLFFGAMGHHEEWDPQGFLSPQCPAAS